MGNKPSAVSPRASSSATAAPSPLSSPAAAAALSQEIPNAVPQTLDRSFGSSTTSTSASAQLPPSVSASAAVTVTPSDRDDYIVALSAAALINKTFDPHVSPPQTAGAVEVLFESVSDGAATDDQNLHTLVTAVTAVAERSHDSSTLTRSFLEETTANMRIQHESVQRQMIRLRLQQEQQKQQPPPQPRTALDPAMSSPIVTALVSTAKILANELNSGNTTAMQKVDILYSALIDLPSLSNDNAPCDELMTSLLQPFFDILTTSLDKKLSTQLRQRALDALVTMTLCRSQPHQIIKLIHILSDHKDLTVPLAPIHSQYAHYHIPYTLSYSDRLPADHAQTLVLTFIERLSAQVTPLVTELLPLQQPMSANPNNSVLLYHPYCLDVTPEMLDVLLSALESYDMTAQAHHAIVHTLLVLLATHLRQIAQSTITRHAISTCH